MSEQGTIMDALLAHATTADATYTTERGSTLLTKLNDEDFPHVFAFNPGFSVSIAPYQQEETTGVYTLMIATKGETQEALLVRVDALRDLIQADPTIGGNVDSSFVSSVEMSEDPRSDYKAAEIVVTTSKVE